MKFDRNKQVLLLLVLLKFLVHVLSYDTYQLHRDAYLYYSLGEHLAWGFHEVPPLIAILSKVFTTVFGTNEFALRLVPALFGAGTMFLIGLMVIEIGGGIHSLILAGSAYFFSPSFLHVGALFQPVSVNHFFWMLCGFLFLRLIQSGNKKYWIWLGLAIGFGFLNKYSIAFFIASIGLGIIISGKKDLFLSKDFLIGMGLGFLIILPNFLWQQTHNWPFLMHMLELRETQLIHVEPGGFLLEQLIMNAHAILIWLVALAILLFSKHGKRYRAFGYGFLALIAILMVGSGKAYYSLGIYPILFAFGGFFFEKLIKKKKAVVVFVLVTSMAMGWYFSIPMDGIPVLTAEKAYRPESFRWEDGELHGIPQDMADMRGWKEIGEGVRELHSALRHKGIQADIFCEHYGQAGAVIFFGKEAGVPHPISTNGSFVFWSPDQLEMENLIYVHTDYNNSANVDSLLNLFFDKVEVHKTIDDRYFRENGTQILFCKGINSRGKEYYADLMGRLKRNYGIIK